MRIIKHGCVIRCNCPMCGCDFMDSEDECYKDHEKEQKGEVKWLAVCPDCGEIDVPGEKQTYDQLAQKDEAKAQEEKQETKGGIDYTQITSPMK